MKVPFSQKTTFVKYAIQKHIGLIGIGLIFILFGSFFAYLGYRTDDGLGFIIFGICFIVCSCLFMAFILPSSIMYYYEQALTKKYGSYTTAKVTNKRIDNYSHTSSFTNNNSEEIEEYLYVIEFEFTYNNKTYKSESFFGEKSTYDAITAKTELPIQFLKTNPNKITLRRRKLSKELGMPKKMCQ